MHAQTCTGMPYAQNTKRMEAENYPREKKKLMNIAQKMLKFQAETSLFLIRKTKH